MATPGKNPLQSPELQPKVLITGATGGLGSALCQAVLTQWAPQMLVAVARNAAKLDALAASLGAPACLHPLVLHDAKETAMAQIAATLKERLGTIDLWLHCVGSLHGPGLVVEKSLRDIDPQALIQAFQINAVNFLLFAKHLKPLFRHDGGVVIAALSAKVGSIGDNHLGGWYSYRMSKAALNMGVHNVALELNRSGCSAICVAIHPGTTATPLSQPFTEGYGSDKLYPPEQSAARILGVLKGLKLEQTGGFFHWDGTPLPW